MKRLRFLLFEKRHQRDLRSDANRANAERLAVLKVRLADVILIAILILAGVFMLPTLNLLSNHQQSSGDLEVVVIVSGTVIFRSPYDPSAEPFEFNWSEGGHSMTIQIAPEGARVLFSDCKDQFCVHAHPIAMPGQSVVCVPNRMIMEIIVAPGEQAGKVSDEKKSSSDIDAVAGRVGGYDAT